MVINNDHLQQLDDEREELEREREREEYWDEWDEERRLDDRDRARDINFYNDHGY